MFVDDLYHAPVLIFSNYKTWALFQFREVSIMTNSAVVPRNPIKIICFEPIFSTMDSYGPICFTKILGVKDESDIPPEESVSRAVTENPRNGSLTQVPAPQEPGGALGLAMMTGTFWRPGRELKIGFQGGSLWQQVRSQTSLRTSESENGNIDQA